MEQFIAQTPNTITVSINAAPDADDIAGGSVAAGAASSGDVHDAVADSDDDDSVLVVTGVAAGNESTNNTIITDDTGVGGDGVAGTYGTLTVAANGTYTYTASATNNIAYNSTATDTFTFTTRDDEGSSGNAGSHAYDVGTITFTVASSISLTNDDDTATEGTPITVTGAQDDVLNDDTADTDGLVVTNISHDNGSESVSSGTTYANGASLTGDYGTLVIGADGSYTFTPNDVLGASETGTDVFTYTADGATATLSIEVTGINDAPTALDNSITTNEDTNHVFSTGEFNFSDDDNSGSLNKIKITSLEDNGALQYYNGSTWVDVTENQEITAADITSGYLRFKPDANENGDDYTSFEFQVSDGTAYSSSSSTMTINVTPVNDAPVAANNTGTILEDGTLTVNDGDGANSSGGVTDDGQTADISNEETSVSGLSFNNDGTKMFVSGGQSDKVHEYSLSTAFDVSTKSATANESYSDISSYDWTRGHTWNANGTKLFIIDNEEGTHQKILEHTVQTAFDLSSTVTRTNAYDLVAPSGGSIPTRPKGITFNSDGTKMYIADHQTDKIHQFTLSVGYNLASTVVNSGTLDVSSQNDSPYGVEFSQDGSKVFVVGNGTQGDAVYQYTLNTAWDITSTATYNDSFNLSSQDSVPADIRFNNDGTKMFIAGSNGNEIDEYTLSTPFEIASISGDHDGDVLVDDTDADSGDTLTVTTYSHTSATDEDGGSISSTSSTGTAGTNNVTGYYGTLDLEDDGSYTYTADLTATQALDPGDTVTDVFTYTVDDGNGETDTATITITVIGVNDTPTASNGTVNINENNQASTAGDRTPSNITKVFAASDFNFADDDTSGSLSKVKITTLESAGDLEYNNGSSWVDVTENQEITASDISNNKLRFTPAANSESNPTFGFKVHDGTDYSSSAYTMTISVNAAPNVTDTTVAGTVAAGATTSSADIHTIVADSDDNDSVLVVTGVASGNESSNNTIITNNTGVGSAVSGTYGSLTVAADGTYTYTASATNNIAYNSTATDTFTFTTRDDETASGSFAYDLGSITFTVASSISLVVDTDAVAEDGTVTHLTNSAGTVISNDAADTNGLVVTNISHTNGNTDTIESGSTYTDSGGEPGSVVGTYGTLKIGADGTYTYTADQAAADALDLNDQVTDVFTYTSDGATATLTITVTGINDNPAAVNDTGYIKEGGTLTVANSAAASSGTSTGNHTGDMTDNDTDDDASSTATITSITAALGDAQTTFSSNSETVTGAYGTLTINSDGSYSYVADSNISGLDAEDANVTDVFTYIVSDGTATSAATLTINVIASQDLTARNDTGTVNEDATLTVSNSGNANSVAAASYDDTDSLTIAGSNSSPVTTQSHFEDLIFNDDGTKMYTLGYASGVSGKNIFQYTLSVPFDVSTASVSSDDYINVGGSWTTDNEAIRFNNDGTKLFVLYDSTTQNHRSNMHQYTLSTPYDITSTVTEGSTFQLGDQSDDFRSFLFNDDGSKMFVSRYGSINEYTLSISFDTSTASKTTAAWWSSNNSYGISNYGSSYSITGMQYNNDGTKLFTVHQQSTVGHTAKIVEWSLSTAYDPMTASTNADFNDTSTYFETGEAVSSAGNGIPTQFITFNNDGTKFFSFNHTHETGSSSSQKIKEWNLASPFNLVNVSGEHSGDVINTSSTDNYDTDPDGDTLTVTTYSHTSATDEDGGSISSTSSTGTAGTNNVTGYYGTLDLEGDGSYTYTADLTATQALDPGDTVTDVFTYTVDDGNGETDTATITITVIGVNDTPVAQNDVGVIVEDGTLTVANSANANLSGSYDATGEHSGDVIDTSSSSHTDSDADASASLTVTAIRTGSSEGSGTAGSIGSALTGTYGQLTIAADGSYSYVANQDLADALDVGDSVTDTFNYTLSDGTATDIGVITITILGANDNPTAVNDTGYIKEGGTLTVANSAAASSGTSTGNHTGDMTDNDTDDDASSTATITSITAALGDAQTTFSSNSETVTGAYGTLTINSNGSYSYVADSNISGLDAEDANVTDVFTYIVSDGTATSAATLTINVIASQDLTARNDTGTVNEDATLEVDDGDNANSITATATFVDSFSVSSQDTAPQDLAFNTDGTKMFVVGSSGDAVNEYTLSTGFDVSTATFVHSFSVSSLDTAPQGLAFNTDGTKMFVLGNSGIDVNEYTLSTGFDVSTASFVDSFSVSSQETNPLGLAFNTDGTKMFVSGTSGADVNEYTLSTGFDVSTATFVDSFSVSSQDIAPYGLAFNTDGTKMFVVGTIGDDVNEYTLSTGFDVSTASFVDSFSVSSQEAVPVGLAFNTDGTKMFVVGHEGDDVTEYSLTTPFSLVNVSGEHSGDVINTSSTDNYDTDPDGDTLTVTTYSHTSATDEDGGSISSTSSTGTAGTNNVTGYYGTLDLEGDGSYTYTADLTATQALDPGDTVTDVFTYTVDDGNGETDTATITITVNGINDTPAADAETGSVDISQTLTVTDGTSDLLHGDTDADASASLSVSSIVATTASGSATAVNPGTAYNSGYTSVTGSKGTLRVGADGTYQYIAGSSTGTDVFTYTLSDGTCNTTATLTITVNLHANNAPTANDDTINVTVGTPATGNVITSSDTDPDSDSLTVSAIAGGSVGSAVTGTYGTFTLNSDGSYTYTVDTTNSDVIAWQSGDAVLTETFTYTVSDGNGGTDTATITVNASGQNDAPTANDDTINVTVGTPATGNVITSSDTDPDSDSLTVSAIAGGSVGSAVTGTYGTFTLNSDGSYTYTVDTTNSDVIAWQSGDAVLTETFTYTVSDGNGGTDTATITVNASGQNDAPTANDDTINVTVGTPATGNVITSSDTDPDSDSLTVSAIAGGSVGSAVTGTYGTFTLNSDGSYTYTVDTTNSDVIAWQSGDAVLTETFTYTVSDGTWCNRHCNNYC